MFHIPLISLFTSCYLSICSFSFSRTLMSPRIAKSIMIQLVSFLFTKTISGFLALISLSYWITTSHKIVTSSFSTTPRACSYHFSVLIRLHFRHNLQWTILATLPYLLLYSFVPTFRIRQQYEICFTFHVTHSTKWWLGCFVYFVFPIVFSNCLFLRSTQHDFCFNFHVNFSHSVPCLFFIFFFWHFSFKLSIHPFVFL